MRVKVSDELKCIVCGVLFIHVLECVQVRVLKGEDHLYLEVVVYHPTIVVHSALFLLLSY